MKQQSTRKTKKKRTFRASLKEMNRHFKEQFQSNPSLRWGLITAGFVLTILLAFLINGNVVFNESANASAYIARLEVLFIQIRAGNFTGVNPWMFAIYSNLQPMVGFDVFTGLSLLFQYLGFSSTVATGVATGFIALFGTLLLHRTMKPSCIPSYVKLLLSFTYLLAILIGLKHISMEYMALLVYGPLYILLLQLFFKKKYWTISIYVFVLLLHNPLTSIAVVVLMTIVFILEVFKVRGSSKEILILVLWYLLFLLLGIVLSIVYYYEAISSTVISIYGTQAIRSTTEILGKTFMFFPLDATLVGLQRFFLFQRTIYFYGNSFFYSIEYWVIIWSFLLMLGSSLAVFFRKKIGTLLSKLDDQFEHFYEDKKKTLIVLAILVFTVLFGIQIAIILIRNSFYNNYSDDIIQYYAIMSDFVAQVKSGSLSWFNLNNYFGASFFSDVYYVPLDIFTFGTYLLSYVMPTELAYSSFELIKIWAGVMLFAYYLSLQGMKLRTVFWMGIVYFVSGGTVSFMAFPVFLSLVFYLPLGLLVIHWFFHGKKWVVPLYAFILIFYDFYLGYTAIAFVSFMFIIEYFKRPNFNALRFLKDGVVFLCLILLGIVMSSVILVPSIQFIIEDTYRDQGSVSSWTVSVFGQNLELFKPNVYIRILAKMFTEQKAIAFYGFENSYVTEHASLYITVIGLVFMNYIYFMKGRIARVYKIAIPIAFIFMIFPIFSYVFSGQFFTSAFGNDASIFSSEFWKIAETPYTRWINMLPLVMTMILAHVFDQHGFEKVKMKWLTIPVVFFIGLLIYLIVYYLEKLALTTTYTSRDVLNMDTVLMGFALVVLVLILVFGWIKRPQWIKKLFWVEVVIAIIYIYTGPFAIPNKINTFQSMASIDSFLKESIDEDDFFRVYVDLHRFDVERLNFNRMTRFPTNTEIFHSWTDMETNEISWLLHGVREYQTKNKMSTMALYVNHVLGYRYVLISATRNFDLESDFFHLISSNSQYKLYEIAHAEPFQVYEQYMTSAMFRTHASSPNKLAVERIMLLNAIINELPEDVHLQQVTTATLGALSTARATRKVDQAILVDEVGSSRKYWRYSNEDLKIGFPVGAIYIKSQWVNPSDYGRVYMEFDDGSQRECEVVTSLTHQVKCEFWKEPTFIYFEQTARFNSSIELEYRMEAAIDSAAYLIYDLPSNAFPSGQGAIYFSLNSGYGFDRVFVENTEGHQTEAFNGYYYLNDSSPKRFYVFKTNEMYQHSNLFAMHLQYVYDNLTQFQQNAPSQVSTNHSLTIKNGTIKLSYERTSDTEFDQIVMIPVAYSEEWVMKNALYKTMSVSGGFLGVVIPHGVEEVDITLTFVPKGLNLGFKVTLAGIGIYGLIFVVPWVLVKTQWIAPKKKED
jgi:hypothetical protein